MKTNQFPFKPILFSVAFAALMACEPSENPTPAPPPVDEGFIEVNGGGATYPNTVYIDLSKEEQYPVARTKWDLAFDTGAEFRVLVNGTTGAMAYPTGKFSMAEIASDLEAQLRTEGALELTFTNMTSILRVDDPSNPLSKTVLGSISATDNQNQVFVYNRGSSGAETRPWRKIRILRKGSNYELQHATVDAATFTSVEIPKKPSKNFVYFSFESGIVDVEPEKTAWDIAWTAGTSSTPFAAATNGVLAYYFQDLVHHNIYGGAKAVQVLETDIAYEDFDETDIASLSFNSDNRLTIGSNWRSGGGPTSAPAIRNDRYYVVQDPAGHVFKVRFLSLTKDGERGRPSFEYNLVKSAQ